MMAIVSILSVILCSAGAIFFLAGTLGLLRFPDTLCRLHAMTKADNLGLGFIVLGLALDAGSWAVTGKLSLIWLLTLLAAASSCYLIGRHTLARRRGGGG
jgi:multicomponent Na+:H+ antiporter subunit G